MKRLLNKPTIASMLAFTAFRVLCNIRKSDFNLSWKVESIPQLAVFRSLQRSDRLLAHAHLTKTSKTNLFSESLLTTESIFFYYYPKSKCLTDFFLKKKLDLPLNYPKSGSFPCTNYLSEVRNITYSRFSLTSTVQCK